MMMTSPARAAERRVEQRLDTAQLEPVREAHNIMCMLRSMPRPPMVLAQPLVCAGRATYAQLIEAMTRRARGFTSVEASSPIV